MAILLHERLAPVTFRMGFLNRPIRDVRNAFVQWKQQHFRSVEAREVSVSLEDAILKLEPLTPIPNKWLLFPTTSDWVAYFDNCQQGPDPAPVIGHLAGQLQCRGLVATSIPHTLSAEIGKTSGLYGAVQFELFAPHKTDFLNYERTVSVAYEDGKWRFDANGKVQPFEQTEKYQKRLVVERFTPEMLTNYCYALGIRIDVSDFYQGPGILISTNDPLPAGHTGLSLVQSQKQMGLTV